MEQTGATAVDKAAPRAATLRLWLQRSASKLTLMLKRNKPPEISANKEHPSEQVKELKALLRRLSGQNFLSVLLR
jgi:hypothetical protein